MKPLSQATIRQFLRTAAVALALGNEAAQAWGPDPDAARAPFKDTENSSMALASEGRSGRELRIAGDSSACRTARRPPLEA